VSARRRARHIAQTAATETVASLRSALWPLAHLRPLPPLPAAGLRPPVVLVHGYLGHPSMWRPLIRRLYSDGWGRVHAVGYPSTRWSFQRIVESVAAGVRRFDEPVVLIGHSLGAVASRAYVRAFDGAPFVRRLVSLGGPHAGTAIYRFTPPNLWDVLDPAGRWVRELSVGPEPVPTVVIRARYDHQVLPPVRASLAGAHEVILDGYGHNGLLWSREAHNAVLDALAPERGSSGG
jgi:triacylglycerol lipase